MSSTFRKTSNCVSHLEKIEVDDLLCVEKDLCFYELVSLGFLLYGDDHVSAQFILQKLLILYRAQDDRNSDLLLQYARSNPNWKSIVVEALAIIKAKRVLRQLGFQWEELRQHYLPHIPELSLRVNPLLKALYIMCERMTQVQAGRMAQHINEQCKKPTEHLRFYDAAYLEIFLLDWFSCKIIQLRGNDVASADLQELFVYFKLNDLLQFKELLVQTIKSNTELQMNGVSQGENAEDCSNEVNANNKTQTSTESTALACVVHHDNPRKSSEFSYSVRRETAGIILIINQKDFYEDPDPELKNLLPKKKLRGRKGTDVDKERLNVVFSSFGYTPIAIDNLTHIELLRHVRETVQRSFMYDSLILCILSHGIDGAVYGSNSIPVEIATIEDIITADTLQGKPKMLIIQACQKEEPPEECRMKKFVNMNNGPDAYIDIVKAMSTLPGYPSIRHTEKGTWFIQSLCDKVDKLGDTMQVSDILIAVTREVSDKRGTKDEVMVPMMSYTTTKHFFFPNRR